MTMQSWTRRTTMKYLAFCGIDSILLSNDFDFLGGTNTWPHSYLIVLYPYLNQRIFIFERILDTNYFD